MGRAPRATLHPAPYTLHPTSYTQHPTSHTLHRKPYTLHRTRYILNPTSHAFHTLHPESFPEAAMCGEGATVRSALNPKP